MVELIQPANAATSQTDLGKATSAEERCQELEQTLRLREAELAQLKESLQETQIWLQLIADTVSGKVCYIDSNKRYRFVSQRFKEWYGISPETQLGITVEELMGTTDYQVIRPYIEAALAGERISYKYTGVLPDGKERYLRINYVPDVRDSGQVLGLVVVIEDLTEFKPTAEPVAENSVLA